jgi:NADPH2:quinone reductase
MRKIIVLNVGAPSVLEVTEVATPQISAGQALVRVEAAGINFLDVYQRQGVISAPRPFTPGFEGVGTVIEAGAGDAAPRPGARVAWINNFGSYADVVLVPFDQLIPIPQDFAISAGLLFQGVTAQYLIREYRTIAPSDVVLVHSAAGGVGQVLVQWAKHLGARVIATASTDKKLEIARKLGADTLINYSRESFREKVLDATEGHGADLVFDAVGAKTFSESVASLAPRGTAVSYGFASGAPGPVEMEALIHKAARVAAGSVFAYISNPSEMRRRASEVLRGIEDGWLRPSRVQTFTLEDAPEAHRLLEGRFSDGKLALIPQGQQT